jgi:hypothetical protein
MKGIETKNGISIVFSAESTKSPELYDYYLFFNFIKIQHLNN